MKSVQYYCKACGAALGESKGLTHCLECHTIIGNGRSFCGQCGLNRAQNKCYNICSTCQASFEEQDKQVSEDIPLSTPSASFVSPDYIGTTVKQDIIKSSNQPIASSDSSNHLNINNHKVKLAWLLGLGCFLLIGSFLFGLYLGRNKNQPETTDNPVAVQNQDPKEPLNEDDPIKQDEPIDQDEPEKIEPQEQDNEIYLDEMTLSETIGVSNEGKPTDVTGKQYLNHYLTISDNGFHDGLIKVYLGKKYSQLSGVIAVDLNTTNEDLAVITIKSDDSVLYSSGQILKSTSPIQLSQLDITDCEWLTIDVDMEGKYLSSKFSVILSDFMLS